MPTLSPTFYLTILAVIVIWALSFTTYFYHGKYEKEVTLFALVSAKNNELNKDIEQENVAIQKLHDDAAARAVRAASYVHQANIRAKTLEEAAQRVLVEKPISGVQDCPPVNKVLNEYIQAVGAVK